MSPIKNVKMPSKVKPKYIYYILTIQTEYITIKTAIL